MLLAGGDYRMPGTTHLAGRVSRALPGRLAQVFDTVVVAEPSRDSSYAGYVTRGNGTALLLSNGFPPSEDRAIYRFAPAERLDRGARHARSYTVDSVVLGLTVVARDTLVAGSSSTCTASPAPWTAPRRSRTSTRC